MGRRTDLHDELKTLLGSNNCYFQPSPSLKLKYPCYVYSRDPSDTIRADNLMYRRVRKYSLTYITKNPDDPLVDVTESHFQMCKFNRHYKADDLNHYHYDLFY